MQSMFTAWGVRARDIALTVVYKVLILFFLLCVQDNIVIIMYKNLCLYVILGNQ